MADILQYCREKGWRSSQGDTVVDGVQDGVAFRAFLSPFSLLLSVSLLEKHMERLQSRLSAVTPVSVALQERGVLITPQTPPVDGEAFAAFLQACIEKAVNITNSAYNDKHESGTAEPFGAYLKGIVGAFGGALVGVIPWLVTGFIGWQFWLLGGLVGVGSFYGYQFLRGAHRTGFAVGAILVCSLLAVFGCELLTSTYYNWQLAKDFHEDPAYYAMYYTEFGDYYEDLAENEPTIANALAFSLAWSELQGTLRESLLGLAVCGVGVFLLKGRIQEYTHYSGFLRSRRFK
ncbi:MAG: hypothetical protein IJW89_03975 [Clostridia bacterium]|nr:hypothetical protein [Clostridia bacterium]